MKNRRLRRATAEPVSAGARRSDLGDEPQTRPDGELQALGGYMEVTGDHENRAGRAADVKAVPIFPSHELPLSVREAALFLGVSPQTVYLWVERKQIPHLRVMGRNIRFLKSDLEPFRAQFKQEVENGETKQA
jgi:excisionase family DNA binding protein